MEHRDNDDTLDKFAASESHRLAMYVDPRKEFLPIAELWRIPEERSLAENAVWAFLENPEWTPRDRINLRKAYERDGNNMFIWKYYAAARCYIGGYKALSAHLMLKRSI